jgi:hypothetical protein
MSRALKLITFILALAFLPLGASPCVADSAQGARSVYEQFLNEWKNLREPKGVYKLLDKYFAEQMIQGVQQSLAGDSATRENAMKLAGFAVIGTPRDTIIKEVSLQKDHVLIKAEGTNPILNFNEKPTEKRIKGRIKLIQENGAWKILECDWKGLPISSNEK